jgi:hypothetical protein
MLPRGVVADAAGGEEDRMNGDAVPDRRETLRQRLTRCASTETLARDGIDGGMLALFGNVSAALDTLGRRCAVWCLATAKRSSNRLAGSAASSQ